MALIERFEKEEKNFRKHEAVETTYSVGLVDGEKLFQINTYGRNSRVVHGVASQTIQLNEESAKELIELLTRSFLL